MMPRGLVSCVKGWQKAQQLLTACRGVGLGRFRESSEGVAGGKEQTSERQNPGEAATWQEEKKEQPRAVCLASTKTTLYRTTVQIGNSHPVHWRLTSEPLAKRPKSRRESGQNTPILKF